MSALNPTSDLTFLRLQGAAIRSVFDELAALRITVFRDFPYLYEGTVDYERAYLETYARANQSLLFTVRDGDRMVGATTALPLRDETAEVQEPFRRSGYDLDSIVYFGESILLPNYRGQGLGHRFFDEREAYARQLGGFSTTCFCAVQRSIDHPLRPSDYQPLDSFWTKRGYVRHDDLQSTFSWPDRGEMASTDKAMTYWMQSL